MPRKVDITAQTIHVLALVLENHQGEILISKRANNKHQGGLWEFPGGKAEKGESRQQTLKREIKEELDYNIKEAQPFILIKHQYPDCHITLDVWYTKDNNPQIKANENQPLKWVKKTQLTEINMPAADKPIIEKILSSNT